MTHPVWLTVAEWTALFALGVLVVLMYRQLGRVFAGKTPAASIGPVLGSVAPSFDYVRVRDGSEHAFLPGGGQPSLVAFVDPTCPSCEALVESFDEGARRGELSAVRTLLVISDPPEYVQISDVFRSTKMEIGRPTTDAPREAYNAVATPLLIAVDAAGVVRAAHPVTTLKDLRAFRGAAVSPPSTTDLVIHHSGDGDGDGNGAAPPSDITTFKPERIIS